MRAMPIVFVSTIHDTFVWPTDLVLVFALLFRERFGAKVAAADFYGFLEEGHTQI